MSSGKKGLNPFPKDNFLFSSKFKSLADSNFKFVEIGRKFSKRVEIASNLSFSHTVFYRLVLQTRACLGKGSCISVMQYTKPIIMVINMDS